MPRRRQCRTKFGQTSSSISATTDGRCSSSTRATAGVAGVGGRTDDETEVGPRFAELPHECAGRVDLTEADRVNEDDRGILNFGLGILDWARGREGRTRLLSRRPPHALAEGSKDLS